MSKTKTITGYVFIVLTLVVVSVYLPVASVSAQTKMNFLQVIRPIPCAVDSIVDIDGQTRYFAPHECGQLVVPSVPSKQPAVPKNVVGNEQPIVSPGGQPQLGPGAALITLDPATHPTTAAAYLLLTQKGQRYAFYLVGDSKLAAPRTMEVLQVTSDAVTLMFTPGDKQAVLQANMRLNANIAFDLGADVSIHVLGMNHDGKATVRVWFPPQQYVVGQVDDTHHSFVAVTILIGVAALAIYSHLHGRMRVPAVKRSQHLWAAM